MVDLEEGEPVKTSTLPRFALFEDTFQRISDTPNPRLRRCAPHLGLTMCNLFEVGTHKSIRNPEEPYITPLFKDDNFIEMSLVF